MKQAIIDAITMLITFGAGVILAVVAVALIVVVFTAIFVVPVTAALAALAWFGVIPWPAL